LAGHPGADPVGWRRLTSRKPPEISPGVRSCSKVDTERYPGLAAQFNVRGIPNFVGVLRRSTSVPAGRLARRSYHGELGYTRGMTERRTRKIPKENSLALLPIGVIRSKIKERSKAPKQGSEGAPDAWLEVHPFATPALDGVAVGDELVVLTWLHRAHRDTLRVRPRSDLKRRLSGVFATRSPDRPNPIGLHQVTVRKISKNRLRIGPIEAIDGTPVIDIKPVLCEIQRC